MRTPLFWVFVCQVHTTDAVGLRLVDGDDDDEDNETAARIYCNFIVVFCKQLSLKVARTRVISTIHHANSFNSSSLYVISVCRASNDITAALRNDSSSDLVTFAVNVNSRLFGRIDADLLGGRLDVIFLADARNDLSSHKTMLTMQLLPLHRSRASAAVVIMNP